MVEILFERIWTCLLVGKIPMPRCLNDDDLEHVLPAYNAYVSLRTHYVFMDVFMFVT